MTFESLELKQSYTPYLKVLLCGVNASSCKWYGCIFKLSYSHLKLALLLHKIVLANFPISTTVCTYLHSGQKRYINYPLCITKWGVLRLNIIRNVRSRDLILDSF